MVLSIEYYRSYYLISPRGPFYWHGLTLIPWISTYIDYNEWDEITYPFSNFNSCAIEVWEWINNFITLSGILLLIHANHVSGSDPRCEYLSTVISFHGQVLPSDIAWNKMYWKCVMDDRIQNNQINIFPNRCLVWSPARHQAIIWINVSLLNWCIYASLSLIELMIWVNTLCKPIRHKWYNYNKIKQNVIACIFFFRYTLCTCIGCIQKNSKRIIFMLNVVSSIYLVWPLLSLLCANTGNIFCHNFSMNIRNMVIMNAYTSLSVHILVKYDVMASFMSDIF